MGGSEAEDHFHVERSQWSTHCPFWSSFGTEISLELKFIRGWGDRGGV